MDTETKFFLAIKNNKLDIVENLLSCKLVDVDQKFAPDNKPAVYIAVECGHLEIVSLLIRYGCSVNHQDRRGETPLHQAVRDRRKDIVVILLQERAKGSILNGDRLTALHLAVYLRRLDIVELLVTSLADSCTSSRRELFPVVFDPVDSETLTPFSLSFTRGYDEIVRYFLTLFDKQMFQEYFVRRRWVWMNPFHYCLNLEEETVCALIETLPLHDLVANSREDRNYMKWSPLHHLSQAADHLSKEKSGRMATILLRQGSAPSDVTDINRQTPLHLAVIRKNEPLVEALLRAGCRMDIRDCWGNSALYYSLFSSASEYIPTKPSVWIIERLLAFGLELERETWLEKMSERNQRTCARDVVLNALLDLKRSGVLLPLQWRCRTVIRRFLKARADEVIKSLSGIPTAQKAFLLVEEERMLSCLASSAGS